MGLYYIGVLITFGMMMEDGSLDHRGFKNILCILFSLILWPVVWGFAIQEYLDKDKAVNPTENNPPEV